MESPNLLRGLQLFELSRYKEAITYFKTAITENPNDFTAKYGLAQCYFQTDLIDDALKIALDLRGESPNDAELYFLLSQIYLHKDNLKESNLNIEQALQLNPFSANNFGQKAYILLNQKQYEEALNFVNQGLQIDPKNTFCLNIRATALTKLKRKDAAQSTIENLLHDNPENAYSHANVGWSHLERNDTKTALKHFKEALKLDPNSEFARNGMLTAMKAKNKIYNLYLRYAFWMTNQSSRNQWIFIIGIYLAYRFGIKLLSASGLTILVVPFIILYLLFALGSWIMEPLSNMILMFDKFGKYLLDKKNKLSGQLMFVLLASALLFFSSYLIFKINIFIILSIASIASILPLTRGALSFTKKTQYINYIYGALIITIAIIAPIISLPFSTTMTAIIVLFIAYTWIGSFILK
jgi:tetratricopeptide (TPR) repeat protein